MVREQERGCPDRLCSSPSPLRTFLRPLNSSSLCLTDITYDSSPYDCPWPKSFNSFGSKGSFKMDVPYTFISFDNERQKIWVWLLIIFLSQFLSFLSTSYNEKAGCKMDSQHNFLLYTSANIFQRLIQVWVIILSYFACCTNMDLLPTRHSHPLLLVMRHLSEISNTFQFVVPRWECLLVSSNLGAKLSGQKCTFCSIMIMHLHSQ